LNLDKTRSNPGTPPPPGVVPLCVPEIRGNEWEYVKECLNTNWVSSAGSFVDRFESEMAALVGTAYGVALSSGTAALHIALLVAGIQSDEEVIVPTLTFIATANAVRYTGAWPVFVDVDPLYWQMDPDKLTDFIANRCQETERGLINNATGRRVKAILPVHILGHPCDMQSIVKIARRHDLTVIEDATESLGAQYQGQMVGHLGDIACLSFNGNKLISTGGGGMILTDNSEWADRAKYLSTQAKDDPVEYVHGEVGYNYRLTNIQAAMGCAQLEQLNDYIIAKARIARTYYEQLQAVPGITTMGEAPWAKSVWWLNTVLVDEGQYGMGSRSLLKHLDAAGIQSRPLWEPLHLSAAHRGAYAEDCNVAERLATQALSLPSSVGLSPSEQVYVIDRVTGLARG